MPTTVSDNQVNACSGCGGPHQFDTSVPSVLWNAVMRKDGIERPEYLCATCIVRAFAEAGTSFVAELYGAGFHGLPIEVRINGEDAQAAAKIQDENNYLRWKLTQLIAAFKQVKKYANQTYGDWRVYGGDMQRLIKAVNDAEVTGR